jgi:probable HAF family extracellular repeat protein
MNDRGQAVGYSGGCGSSLGDFFTAYHAVMWQDGKPTDLGSLGGTIFNVPLGINNRGDIVGISALPGDTVGHGFLWMKGHMTDLGTLPGDVISFGNSINDDGVVAMQSCDATVTNCRAAILRDGVLTELNTLIPAKSQLLLMVANSINSRGEIVGNALDQETGATVPFLATPCDGQEADSDACAQAADDTSVIQERPALSLPDSLRRQLRRQRGFGQLETRGPGMP